MCFLFKTTFNGFCCSYLEWKGRACPAFRSDHSNNSLSIRLHQGFVSLCHSILCQLGDSLYYWFSCDSRLHIEELRLHGRVILGSVMHFCSFHIYFEQHKSADTKSDSNPNPHKNREVVLYEHNSDSDKEYLLLFVWGLLHCIPATS